MTTDDVNDEQVAAHAITSGAVIGARVAAWITARHLLAETARPLPTDVLALALWLTGGDPDDEEDDDGDLAVDTPQDAPERALAGEDVEDEHDFAPVWLGPAWPVWVRRLFRKEA